MQDVKVVLATDENYAAPTAVAIRSAIVNSNVENRYTFYILHSGLSDKAVKKLEALGTENVSIQCMNICNMTRAVKGLKSNHLTQETLYRLYIPELFAEDRIVYMDSDMILCDDIAKLYEVDVTGYVMAAAGDVVTSNIIEHYSKFTDTHNRFFFNAGLLLINCYEFKIQNIKERCLKILTEDVRQSTPMMTFMDQDALNCICSNNTIRHLDMSWNFQPLVHNDNGEFTILSDECRDDYDKALRQHKLIHYTGGRKPWLCPGIFLAEEFLKYEKNVEFEDEFEKLKDNYAIKLSQRFPFWNIKRGSRIIIYGMGNHGRQLKKLIEDSCYAEIAAITDGKVVSEERYCLPENLGEIQFDNIIIAIENEMAVGGVFEKLLSLGIKKNKIIWLFERNHPWE